MKRSTVVGVIIALLGIGLIGGIVFASNNYLDNQSKAKEEKTVACAGAKGTRHEVKIQNDQVTPKHTDGRLCDTLVITNLDPKVREIAFGVHSQHVAYDGIEEEPVDQTKSLTVTLNKTGEFLFHDHDQDDVRGTFTVTN